MSLKRDKRIQSPTDYEISFTDKCRIENHSPRPVHDSCRDPVIILNRLVLVCCLHYSGSSEEDRSHAEDCGHERCRLWRYKENRYISRRWGGDGQEGQSSGMNDGMEVGIL